MGVKSALQGVKQGLAATLAYLGSAPHRRAVAVLVSLVATKLIGHALNADDVANAIDLAVGAAGGAWSSSTPPVQNEVAGG